MVRNDLNNDPNNNSSAIIAIIVIVLLAAILLFYLYGGPEPQTVPATPTTSETNIRVDNPTTPVPEPSTNTNSVTTVPEPSTNSNSMPAPEGGQTDNSATETKPTTTQP